MAYDVITLINVDARALGDAGGEMLKDFVTHGGTLVYGGDFWAYSRGNIKGTAIETLLPVRVQTAPTAKNPLFPVKGQPLEIIKNGKQAGTLADTAVMMYMAEQFALKDHAELLLRCGNQPVVVSWRVGQGRVIAITGTILGKAPRGKVLFYQTPAWIAWCKNLLTQP